MLRAGLSRGDALNAIRFVPLAFARQILRLRRRVGRHLHPPPPRRLEGRARAQRRAVLPRGRGARAADPRRARKRRVHGDRLPQLRIRRRQSGLERLRVAGVPRRLSPTHRVARYRRPNNRGGSSGAELETITVETSIPAPPERCFDAARDLDLHVKSVGNTKKRGRRTEAADRARRRSHVARDAISASCSTSPRSITAFRPPHYFQEACSAALPNVRARSLLQEAAGDRRR